MMKKIILVVAGLLIALPAFATSPIKIAKFKYDAFGPDDQYLNKEYIVLKNKSFTTLNLRRWRVLDNDGHMLVLPKFSLKPLQTVTIYTGKGENKLTGDKKKVYWNRRFPMWNNDFDVFTLLNRKKKIVLRYRYK